MGLWVEEQGRTLIDSGAHFYDAYETADGKYVSGAPSSLSSMPSCCSSPA
jgi:hypothetical protein